MRAVLGPECEGVRIGRKAEGAGPRGLQGHRRASISAPPHASRHSLSMPPSLPPRQGHTHKDTHTRTHIYTRTAPLCTGFDSRPRSAASAAQPRWQASKGGTDDETHGVRSRSNKRPHANTPHNMHPHGVAVATQCADSRCGHAEPVWCTWLAHPCVRAHQARSLPDYNSALAAGSSGTSAGCSGAASVGAAVSVAGGSSTGGAVSAAAADVDSAGADSAGVASFGSRRTHGPKLPNRGAHLSLHSLEGVQPRALHFHTHSVSADTTGSNPHTSATRAKRGSIVGPHAEIDLETELEPRL